jgi:alkylhydroperoxidase/carboxymuconolactone decarboxylase family protein YurZ
MIHEEPDMSNTRKARGAKAASDTPLTEAYIASGDWNPLWDAVRALDPEFVEAYLAFRSVPHRKGPLPPKFKELVLIAVNVATTHLYAPGARRHMQNALRLGATAEEILEVIQLTTVMGIHSVNMAVPMLVEELAKVDAATTRGSAPSVPKRVAPGRAAPQPDGSRSDAPEPMARPARRAVGGRGR